MTDAPESSPEPTRRLGRTWPTILVAIASAAIAAVVTLWVSAPPSPSGAVDGGTSEREALYTCSMHPQIRSSRPGTCPICGMPLVPIGGREAGGKDARVLEVSERARALARVETAPVVRSVVTSEAHAVGKVQYDETGLSTVVARVDGFVERIFVEYVGAKVRKGARLVQIYSPELAAAQNELLIAARQAPSLLPAARNKLEQFGVTSREIDEVLKEGRALPRITLVSPIAGTVIERDVFSGGAVARGQPLYKVADLRRVWVQIEAFESQLPFFAVGDDVRLEVEALPGKEIRGSIAFIDPTLDESTRTVAVRIEVPNPTGTLRPGMYVRAHIVDPDSQRQGVLTVPASAVLDSGTRRIVYVEDEPGRYRAVKVRLGARNGDVYPVLEGLHEGQRVASHAAFLLDSQAQIEGLESLFEDQGAATHQHGDTPDEGARHLGTHEEAPASHPAVEPRQETGDTPRYACPMHPEQRSDRPGTCPICKMALEPLPAATKPEVGR